MPIALIKSYCCHIVIVVVLVLLATGSVQGVAGCEVPGGCPHELRVEEWMANGEESA